ncbi:MAG: PAS fold protein [Methanocella sp. PtaU1.Bin125]|nr:MAG: PAS fold protein [Methanocella sp. PtaU1.Bin125]
MLVKKSARLAAGSMISDLAAYDRLSVPVLAVGKDFRILLINEKACEQTGYSREDVRDKKLFDIASPGDLKSRMLRMFKGKTLAGDFTASGSLVTKNGRIRKVEWQCRIRYEGTSPAGAVITFVDLTGAVIAMELARIMAGSRTVEETTCRFMDLLSDPLNMKIASISLDLEGGETLTYTRAYPHGGMQKKPRHALRDSQPAPSQTYSRVFMLVSGDRAIGRLELKTYGGSPLMAEDEAYVSRLCETLADGIARLSPGERSAEHPPSAGREPPSEETEKGRQLLMDADESREMINHLMSMLPHGMMIYGRDGRVVMANEVAGRILGINRHDLEGRSALEIARGLREERASGRLMTGRSHAICRALGTGAPVHNVRSTILVDGWRRVINTSAVPLRNAAGIVTGCISTLRDVTAMESIVRLGNMAVKERNVNDLIEESLDVILNASGLRTASLYVRDGNTLRLKVQKGEHEGMPVPVCADEPDAQNPTIQSRVYLSGKPLVIKDYRRCASVRLFDPLARKRPVQSMAGIPLRSDRGVIGVLVVATGEGQPLADVHVTELTAMCSQLAAGIDRALRLDL